MVKLAAAGLALAAVLWLCEAPVAHVFAGWHRLRDLATLAVLAAIGGVRLWRDRVAAVRPRAGLRRSAPGDAAESSMSIAAIAELRQMDIILPTLLDGPD